MKQPREIQLHEAIVGMTSSGKSVLGKAKAGAHRARGHGVLVCDPWRSPDWPADWITSSLSALRAKAEASRRCAIFIEEAGDYGRDPEFAWFFTQARHWGHATHYLTQYHAQVPPIVRSNCERLSLFRVAARSAAVWAEDFAQPEIAALAATLPRFHFVAAGRYDPARVCTLRI